MGEQTSIGIQREKAGARWKTWRAVPAVFFELIETQCRELIHAFIQRQASME